MRADHSLRGCFLTLSPSGSPPPAHMLSSKLKKKGGGAPTSTLTINRFYRNYTSYMIFWKLRVLKIFFNFTQIKQNYSSLTKNYCNCSLTWNAPAWRMAQSHPLKAFAQMSFLSENSSDYPIFNHTPSSTKSWRSRLYCNPSPPLSSSFISLHSTYLQLTCQDLNCMRAVICFDLFHSLLCLQIQNTEWHRAGTHRVFNLYINKTI